ncbi:MAG: hypothetical protein JNM24_04640 [Bdellovibrionaceae bacterium]|nr:hypothetical protein [Pseudobdellovibrionaceae bacterium]
MFSPKKTFTETGFDQKGEVGSSKQVANVANPLNLGKEKDPKSQYKLSNDVGYTLGLKHEDSRETSKKNIV